MFFFAEINNFAIFKKNTDNKSIINIFMQKYINFTTKTCQCPAHFVKSAKFQRTRSAFQDPKEPSGVYLHRS